MIWLKRALPILVLAAAWFGYSYFRTYRAEQRAAEDARRALVTAQIWVASAAFRADSQAYLAYRDSLLQANNMTADQMFRFLEDFESDPNRQLMFSQQVSRNIDSLVKVKDSTWGRGAVVPQTNAEPGGKPSAKPLFISPKN